MQFSERIKGVKGSAIRELFKVLGNPAIISFGGGNPAKECFPKEWAAETAKALIADKGDVLLQYGPTEGYMPLRRAYLEKVLPPLGITDATIDNVITMTGSMQGLDLLAKVMINPGSTVLVEEPTFLGAIQIFKMAQANIISVPMHEDGVHADELEEIVKRERPVMFYTIPTFQNPTGRIMGIEARKMTARLAAEYDMLVIEDDPYAALRYSGQVMPLIKTFDTSDNVILLTSYSKTISPGLRVACCCGNAELVRKMVIAKQGSDTHSPNLNQALIAEFLNQERMPEHLDYINSVYSKSMNIMLDAMDKYFPEWAKYDKPEGGLFVWVTLPEGMDATEIYQRSVKEKLVAYVPGAPFYTKPGIGDNTFRMNFSAEPEERIVEGVHRLGDLLKEYRA
ncbi:MAG: PLP-dependent aminotransferase family protein [Clostridia bacterium]|nr:PLP-dependent aminotransferase family protein [Clostridia bacterium]